MCCLILCTRLSGDGFLKNLWVDLRHFGMFFFEQAAPASVRTFRRRKMPATSGEGATPPGLPVSLVHDSYKGEAPTEPGAVGRMGGILQQQTRKHLTTRYR